MRHNKCKCKQTVEKPTTCKLPFIHEIDVDPSYFDVYSTLMFFLKIGVDLSSLLLAREPYTDLSSIITDLPTRVIVNSYYNMPFSLLILLSRSSDDGDPLPNQIL